MQIFLLAFMALPVLAQCPSADLTQDCFVDLADFAVVSSQWLNTQTDLNPLINQWLTGDRLPDDMVVIPAGTFQMGYSYSWEANQKPVHPVTVESFAIGKYEITNGQYRDFLNSALAQDLISVIDGVVYKTDSGIGFPYCRTSEYNSFYQIVFSNNTFSIRTKGGKDMTDHPAYATWYGTVAYCNWRSRRESKEVCYDLFTWTCDFSKKGYRLPTEAEWEYVASGGAGNRFPWGNTITHNKANYFSFWQDYMPLYSYDLNPISGYHPVWDDGYWPYTSPVGSFPATRYGLYDIVGNVTEWCYDWYSSSYYSSSQQNNPTGPETGRYRVYRGGSWNNHAESCRVWQREGSTPDENAGGFRIVLGLK